MNQPIPVGQTAPDFTLPVKIGETITLSDYRGKPVILAFYPSDWSPVCGDQMAFYNDILPDFAKHNAVLLGISVDGVWCHQAYAESRGLSFPLLSDFEPKGAVSKQYGVYHDEYGISERALFVLDKNGVVVWNYAAELGENPGADGIIEALEALAR